MNSIKLKGSRLRGFTSGVSLGGEVSHYRRKQNIYTEGSPAYSLFYIQHGGVRLTTGSKRDASAVTAILGVGDFFGELCLAGYPFRTSTAVALTASVIRTIEKNKMLKVLRDNAKVSNSFVAYLLSGVQNYQDDIAHLLTSAAEQRLARVLLRLARLNSNDPAAVAIPIVSQDVLANMVGTTRSRVNRLMSRFLKQGLVRYDGGLRLRPSSLQTILDRR